MTTEHRGLFARSPRHRLVLGVAGGLADTLGVDPVLVRLGLAALTVASGVGILLYLVAWSLSYELQNPGAVVAPPSAWRWRPTVAMACIVMGSLLVLRDVGLWSGDTLVWPLVIAGTGSAIIWFRTNSAERARWSAAGGRLVGPSGVALGGWVSRLRLLVGGLIVLSGMTVFLFAHQSDGAAPTAALAVAVTAARTRADPDTLDPRAGPRRRGGAARADSLGGAGGDRRPPARLRSPHAGARSSAATCQLRWPAWRGARSVSSAPGSTGARGRGDRPARRHRRRGDAGRGAAPRARGHGDRR